MSSFSSVVRKPGQKFAPKAAPRRNVTRKVAPPTPAATPDTTAEDGNFLLSSTLTEAEDVVPPAAERVADPDPPTPPAGEASASANDHVILSKTDTSPRLHRTSRTHPNHTSLEHGSGPQADGASVTQDEQVSTAVGSPGAMSEAHDSTSDSTPISIPTLAPAAVTTSPTNKRKRKNPPRAAPNVLLSATTVDETPTAHVRAAEISNPDDTEENHVTVAEIEHATEQAALIADIAQNITTAESRSLRPLARARASTDDTAGANTETEGTSSQPMRKKRRRKTAQEQASDIVANAMGDGATPPTRRRGTPEEATSHEVAETEVTMKQLCQEPKWGKKSELEAEIQANWPEILRRRKEDRDRAMDDAANRRKKAHQQTKPAAQLVVRTEQQTAGMLIINGQIRIDPNSREIDRAAQLQDVIEETHTVREDKDIYKRVNAFTVGVKARTPFGQRWDDSTTELFYQGLRMFGTDFMMVANMIPGKTRKQVKLKYNAEEKVNLARIRQCLAQREAVALDDYESMTGIQFADHLEVYAQMEADEKRIREEDEQRRRDEGIVQNNTADAALPSIEGEGADDVADPASREARIQAAADAVVNSAVAPSKKKQTRKTAATSRRGRQVAAARSGMEGQEERLGTIDEVAV